MPQFSKEFIEKVFRIQAIEVENFEAMYSDGVFDEIISRTEMGLVNHESIDPRTGTFKFIGNPKELQSFAYSIWGEMKRDT